MSDGIILFGPGMADDSMSASQLRQRYGEFLLLETGWSVFAPLSSACNVESAHSHTQRTTSTQFFFSTACFSTLNAANALPLIVENVQGVVELQTIAICLPRSCVVDMVSRTALTATRGVAP